MFNAIGKFAYKFKFLVVFVFLGLFLGLGLYGSGLDKNLSSSGYFANSSDSVIGTDLANEVYERDASSDLLLLITAPENKTLLDPEVERKIKDSINKFFQEYPNEINQIYSYWNAPNDIKTKMITEDEKIAFASIWLNGETANDILNNFETIKDKLKIDGIKTQLAGQIAVTGSVNNSTARDTSRAELIALPLVALMLLLIFGGVIAALLPVLIGGLTIAGSLGLMNYFTNFMEVNQFTRPVITMIGLGIAIDYGLFIVSRFREEIAEKKPISQAVKNTVATASRTVVFSAVLIIGSLCSLFFFPQPFLHSVALGSIISVGFAAICSLFVLPAILAILGTKIDALGFKFLRKTKTKEEIENGFWGKLASFVMRNPRKIAAVVLVFLIVLIIPTANLKLGGIDEKLLPPTNETRIAMENFNTNFPQWRTSTIKVVVENADEVQQKTILENINKVPGFSTEFSENTLLDKKDTEKNIKVYSAGLIDPATDEEAIKELRKIQTTDSAKIYVGGDSALQVDSLQALKDNALKALIFLLVITFLLMFLAFGSFVLPFKAMLVSILGLGATLGILTVIFTNGFGQEVLDFTPGPLMAPVLMLIIAILYGLSTDYEVLLMSRMIEAKARGNSTEASIRKGMAYTGRIITAAAAILIVVVGAFGFSELVIMQYIAFGMIFALIIDATIVRMLLVPSIMKFLGEDVWWAPKIFRRLQNRVGLGNIADGTENLTAVMAFQEQNNSISSVNNFDNAVNFSKNKFENSNIDVFDSESFLNELGDFSDEKDSTIASPQLSIVPDIDETAVVKEEAVSVIEEFNPNENPSINPILNDNDFEENPMIIDFLSEEEIKSENSSKIVEFGKNSKIKSKDKKTKVNEKVSEKDEHSEFNESIEERNPNISKNLSPVELTEIEDSTIGRIDEIGKNTSESVESAEPGNENEVIEKLASTDSNKKVVDEKVKDKKSKRKSESKKTVQKDDYSEVSEPKDYNPELEETGRHADLIKGISAADLLKRERKNKSK